MDGSDWTVLTGALPQTPEFNGKMKKGDLS